MEVAARSFTVARPTASRAARRRALAWLWSGALLALLAFLVLYPLFMLLLGALTDANPVADGIRPADASLANFAEVLANPNVHLALLNSLVACTGGTAIAVFIGLAFAWIVVRTDTPWERLIATAGLLPLFVPPLVAGVAWTILGSPRTGLLNIVLGWLGIGWRLNFYSTPGLIAVFARNGPPRAGSSGAPGNPRAPTAGSRR